ncbi:MAG: hypothetical protein WCP33_02750 [Deltaproteobacteria bacterium]
MVNHYYRELIAPFWPPERRYVEDGYATIPFPFAEIDPPEFAMEISWNLEQLKGYFSTWSATREYVKQKGSDPLALIADELAVAWGDPCKTLRVKWPLALRVGRVEPQS